MSKPKIEDYNGQLEFDIDKAKHEAELLHQMGLMKVVIEEIYNNTSTKCECCKYNRELIKNLKFYQGA
jgi:hypothetical protein